MFCFMRDGTSFHFVHTACAKCARYIFFHIIFARSNAESRVLKLGLFSHNCNHNDLNMDYRLNFWRSDYIALYGLECTECGGWSSPSHWDSDKSSTAIHPQQSVICPILTAWRVPIWIYHGDPSVQNILRNQKRDSESENATANSERRQYLLKMERVRAYLK